MKILIVNDDGIQAPGLIPFARWAQKLGEVTVVAPKYEQSGKSHGIQLGKAFEVKPMELVDGVRVFSVDSTPADCVRFAVHGMKETFDLVLSGINRGFNMGRDIMYSGTVGAVFESIALGIPAIAVSTSPSYYDHAAQHLDTVWSYIKEHDLLSVHALYNINIPADPGPVRITRQGGPFYCDDFPHQGNDMYLPVGKCIYEDGGNEDVDTDCVMHGFISITPLTTERTDLTVFHKLKENQ